MGQEQWYLIFKHFVLRFDSFVVMTSGGYLSQAVVEEKENRTMEIVITSCITEPPMTGKIIGNIAVGLTQLIALFLFDVVGIKIAGRFLAGRARLYNFNRLCPRGTTRHAPILPDDSCPHGSYWCHNDPIQRVTANFEFVFNHNDGPLLSRHPHHDESKRYYCHRPELFSVDCPNYHHITNGSYRYSDLAIDYKHQPIVLICIFGRVVCR